MLRHTLEVSIEIDRIEIGCEHWDCINF